MNSKISELMVSKVSKCFVVVVHMMRSELDLSSKDATLQKKDKKLKVA
jgi:hypothetical protein